MRPKKIALLVAPGLAVIPLLASGCGDDPSIEITTPDDGEVLDAGDIQVAVEVENFDIVDRIGDPPEDGEGHIHFYLDVDDVPTDPDEPAVTEEGTYHATAANSHTWEDVGPGEHTLAVQLVDNDHSALDEAVVEQVTVTVEGAAQPTRGASPTPRGTVSPTPEESPEEEEETATPTPRASPAASPSP